MTAARLIDALISRISSDRARIETLNAEKGALQSQLAKAMTGSAVTFKQWTFKEVVDAFSVYDPGKIEAIAKALNEPIFTSGGEDDRSLSDAIVRGLQVLDRSNAVDLLEHAEHEEYGTPEPPLGPLAERMISVLHPDVAASESIRTATPAAAQEPGIAIDEASGKPIVPLRAEDAGLVPKKPIIEPAGGKNVDKIEEEM